MCAWFVLLNIRIVRVRFVLCCAIVLFCFVCVVVFCCVVFCCVMFCVASPILNDNASVWVPLREAKTNPMITYLNCISRA